MAKHSANVWLVNTGWSGGSYGSGKRMKLSLTRAIIDAIHNGSLASAPTIKDDIFGFDVVTEVAGVPSDVLIPKNTWSDKEAYDATAKKLATLFINNFKTYSEGASEEVRAAGPVAK
jgi:phosphoenolpyruvate carboxykinase (ATP)